MKFPNLGFRAEDLLSEKILSESFDRKQRIFGKLKDGYKKDKFSGKNTNFY